MTDWKERAAKKNRIPYMMVEKIYIGDYSTYLLNTGDGAFEIHSPKCRISTDAFGNMTISGNLEIKGQLDAQKMSSKTLQNISGSVIGKKGVK